jgi:hypothetical protein
MTKELQSESSGANFIDVGIHENVELTKIEYNVTDKGNEYMGLYFSDTNGRELSHTEWKPTDQDPERLASKETNQMRRIKHIATKFVSEDELIFNVQTFKEFAERIISILNGKTAGKKVRIKVVYSYNNYTSLPNYLPFIESMDTPTAQSKLEISSIDKMTRDQADREVTVENPFETTDGTSGTNQIATTTGDELPF